MKSIIVKKVEHIEDVQTTDDLTVQYDVVDLYVNTPFTYLGECSKTLTNFNKMLQEENAIQSNFYLDGEMPFNRPSTTPFEYVPVKQLPKETVIQSTQVSLITLFNLLQQEEESSFLFQPHMYKDITGSQSFENFIPDSLNNIIVPFRNMIISNKKFNVVFATVISGRVQHDVTNGEVYRYYPFKVVKGGELLYDKLQVAFPKGISNKFLEQQIVMNSTQEGIYYNLDLSRFPIFDEMPTVTATDFIHLRRELDSSKKFSRALKYAIDELRVHLQFSGEIGVETDWYRGDEVILDSLSDSGAPILDAWITGQKSMSSFNTIKSNLGQIGDQLFGIINNNLTNEVPLEITEKITGELSVLVNDLIKKNWIASQDASLLVNLIFVIKLTGTPKEKFLNLKSQLNKLNKTMNTIELKYLNIRHALLKECPSKELMANDYLFTNFGEITNSNVNNITYASHKFNEKLTLKRTVVKDSEYNSNSVMNIDGLNSNDSVNNPLANNPTDFGIDKPTITTNFKERD